jgi:hypothetical protein
MQRYYTNALNKSVVNANSINASITGKQGPQRQQLPVVGVALEQATGARGSRRSASSSPHQQPTHGEPAPEDGSTPCTCPVAPTCTPLCGSRGGKWTLHHHQRYSSLRCIHSEPEQESSPCSASRDLGHHHGGNPVHGRQDRHTPSRRRDRSNGPTDEQHRLARDTPIPSDHLLGETLSMGDRIGTHHPVAGTDRTDRRTNNTGSHGTHQSRLITYSTQLHTHDQQDTGAATNRQHVRSTGGCIHTPTAACCLLSTTQNQSNSLSVWRGNGERR